MAKAAKPAPKFDWYFRQWCDALDIKFPHAWLQRELGYSDGKASNVLTGKKRYDRDLVNEIAGAMHITPAELLMHPADAMALRRQREAAMAIAQQGGATLPAPAADERKKAG
jgi:hypothetical protein